MRCVDPADLVARPSTVIAPRSRSSSRSSRRAAQPAREAVALLHPHTGRAWSVGITGAPGAGKSTLTDKLVGVLRADDLEVGVLAIDPTSPFSGGAILGDRVRMQEHATDPGVFIRSMATRGHLGGLAVATPQAARVLDAAGKPWIVVETVGVGQVEVEIAGQADTTVVVVNPGWGDAVQAAKAGLLEIADMFVVNKADRAGVDETVRDLEGMLEMAGERDWRVPIVRTVATTGDGVDDLWRVIREHRAFLERTGRVMERRAARCARRGAFDRRRAACSYVRLTLCRGDAFDALVDDVAARRRDPYDAADDAARGRVTAVCTLARSVRRTPRAASSRRPTVGVEVVPAPEPLHAARLLVHRAPRRGRRRRRPTRCTRSRRPSDFAALGGGRAVAGGAVRGTTAFSGDVMLCRGRRRPCARASNWSGSTGTRTRGSSAPRGSATTCGCS